MLKKPFDKARQGIKEHLSHQNHQTGQTWFEFCHERGFAYSEMLSGLDGQKRL